MKKQTVDLIKNYLRRLSDEDRTFLQTRLRDKYGGDVAEAVALMQRSSDIDRWLASAQSADELYDMIDIIHQYIDNESEVVTSK